jgi:hypothetical protein
MLDKQQISDMGRWSGFVGIVTLISGIISCITIVGIIPGVVAIIIGLKLRSVKSYADQIVAYQDEESQVSRLNLMMTDLSTYFKIQGILMIIGLALVVIGILIAIAAAAFSFTAFNMFYW